MISNYQKQWHFLKKSVELDKMPHALLFYGQDGSSQVTLALDFIKLLNCQNDRFDERPCQKCRSCRDVEKRVHPDLFIIEPKEGKEIKINQIRELNSCFSLRAYSAPFKTAVIVQAHCLNGQAQSAFLKLLEEPKGKTLFILITEYPEMLLSTILSRVERLRFYSFLAEPQRDDYQKKIIAEIIQVSKQDLAKRFQYAQKLAGTGKDLRKILDIWSVYFRENLLASINGGVKTYSLTKLSKILRLIQTISFLISTTNINSRLALEMLMLEL